MQNKPDNITQYADIMNEPPDAALVQLVSDLDAIYTIPVPSPRFKQALAEALDKDSVSPDIHSRGLSSTLPVQHQRTHSIVMQRKSRWVHLLYMIAAVLIVTLTVGSLLFVLHTVQPFKSSVQSKPGKQATPLTKPYAIGSIWQLQMIDVNNGWAWAGSDSARTYTLLHTVDGGIHWKDVNPLSFLFTDTSAVFILNTTDAWMTVPQTTTTTLLYRTTDGGHDWQSSLLPIASASTMTFINDHTGWLIGNASGDMTKTSFELYHTDDGGLTWGKGIHTRLAVLNGPLQLSLLNASTGWLLDNGNYLYVTHDAGQNWYQQMLPLSPTMLASSLSYWPPQFLSTQDGIIRAMMPGDLAGQLLQGAFVTHDGGGTWQRTTFIHSSDRTGPVDFADAIHGWLWDGVDTQPLNVTNDGGQHWTKLDTSASFFEPTLDFVNSRIGWVVGDANNGTLKLYKTVDGGHTWTFINYTTSF